MPWYNPSYKPVAHRIDAMFKNEKDANYFTLGDLDPQKRKKFDAVTDEMYVHLATKWMQHKNLSSREARLTKARANANLVIKSVKNEAASSMVNRATDVALTKLDYHASRGIPLLSSSVGGRTFAAGDALTPPVQDGGSVLTRSNSRSESAVSAHEPPAYEVTQMPA